MSGAAPTYNDGPAQVSMPQHLAAQSGSGFEQFVAQARLASMSKEDPNYATLGQFVANKRRSNVDDIAANLGLSAQEMQALGLNLQLDKDEWKTLDDRLLRVAQENLTMVDDLRGAGLTINTDLGNLIHEWQTTNEFSAADVDMNPDVAASEDATVISVDGVALPIVHKSFHIPFRTLMASRNRGESLDTVNQGKAARAVMEGLEDLFVTGWNGTVGGHNVPGLTGANQEGNINTTTSSNDWDDTSGTTVAQIRSDIVSQIEALEDDNYGPEGTSYMYWLDRSSYQALRSRDTGTDQERSLLSRLEEEFVPDTLQFLKPADHLPTGTAVLLKPIEDVIQLAVASDIQNVEWESNAGFTTHMKVMGSITPVIKSDHSGQSGIHVMDGLLS